ncbi:Nramp family divalent metal transporter [bacterium]|nr:Nramp family divalent metal transporter [bacterium]
MCRSNHDKPNGGAAEESIRNTLPESYHTIAIPAGSSWRKMLAFAGPGFMVAVGYMDPGNWATDIAAGARFNYLLISVVLISSLMAMFLQRLALRLGIATGRDLAQSCRDTYSHRATIMLWVLCEIAIAATDLAEVLGSAIALNLLFHIPLALGVCITAADVLVVLLLQHKGFRAIEAIVLTLIGTIGVCFSLELYYSQPAWGAVAAGLLPSGQIVADPHALYIAIGILGATVMPHNLYLHSSIVQTRNYEDRAESKREAIRFATIDSTVALTLAFFINAAILVMAAATFYRAGHHDVTEIGDAYKMLSPLLGAPAAGALFGLALLASGQNSTLTGTLAGQIVMEGFLNLRLAPAIRRLITRLIAIVPAVIVTLIWGSRGVTELLILSQVILSLQLSFATFPLLFFTSDRGRMGEFVNSRLTSLAGWAICGLIAILNVWLILSTIGEWLS